MHSRRSEVKVFGLEMSADHFPQLAKHCQFLSRFQSLQTANDLTPCQVKLTCRRAFHLANLFLLQSSFLHPLIVTWKSLDVPIS